VALARLLNPLVRRLAERGVAGGSLLVLRYRGRRTGRAYAVPVGYHVLDAVVHVVTDSGWRHNFATPAEVEVTLRGRRRRSLARLQDDPDEVADVLDRLVRRLGVRGAERRLGLRIAGDEPPSRAELTEAVQRTGLSVVVLEHEDAG
jgi:hypothetical protein